MAYVPYSPQAEAPYQLRDPLTGWSATFNDPTAEDYVGMVVGDSFAGLDSAEVRESSQELVEADGGVHGLFYFGRRPITMTVRVFGAASLQDRDIRIDRLRKLVKRGLRGDLELKWQNLPADDNAAMMTWVRLQQPFRSSGGWVKDCPLALVSQYAPLFGQTLKQTPVLANGTPSTVTNAENQGDWPAFPIITITGPGSGTLANPQVRWGTSAANYRYFRTTGLTLAANEAVEFDMLTHTGVFTVGARIGQSANRYIDFAGSQFPPLETGGNIFLLSGTSGGSMRLRWRDTWS